MVQAAPRLLELASWRWGRFFICLVLFLGGFAFCLGKAGNSEHKIFTMAGVDRVAFRLSGNVYAAGSTF